MYTLHNYFRSSTSFRVRIALEMKAIAYNNVSYALLNDEHRSAFYLDLNPDGLVPTLETPDGPIGQSLAILEYLDEVHPNPALLPDNALARARVRSLAHSIALDIHPINNLRVLKYLRAEFGAEDAAVTRWFQHWVAGSFEAIEKRLSSEAATGLCCHGDKPGLADICLVAQAVNNQRFSVPMDAYPTINRIVSYCLAMDAFEKALPANQPDAPEPG